MIDIYSDIVLVVYGYIVGTMIGCDAKYRPRDIFIAGVLSLVWPATLLVKFKENAILWKRTFS